MTVHTVENKGQFDEKLKTAGDGLVVVDFFATWCGPCKAISPKLVELSNNDKYSNVTFLKIDVDQVPDVAQELGIRAMPTFKYFKNGEEVDDVVGANPQALVQALDKHIAA